MTWWGHRGLLFGILGVMFFYNLSLCVFTHNHSYETYTLCLLTSSAYELTVTGLGPIYVWPDGLRVKTHAYACLAARSFLAATRFFRVFLTLGQASEPHRAGHPGVLDGDGPAAGKHRSLQADQRQRGPCGRRRMPAPVANAMRLRGPHPVSPETA